MAIDSESVLFVCVVPLCRCALSSFVDFFLFQFIQNGCKAVSVNCLQMADTASTSSTQTIWHVELDGYDRKSLVVVRDGYHFQMAGWPELALGSHLSIFSFLLVSPFFFSLQTPHFFVFLILAQNNIGKNLSSLQFLRVYIIYVFVQVLRYILIRHGCKAAFGEKESILWFTCAVQSFLFKAQ